LVLKDSPAFKRAGEKVLTKYPAGFRENSSDGQKGNPHFPFSRFAATGKSAVLPAGAGKFDSDGVKSGFP
jgi:hypothetical protein